MKSWAEVGRELHRRLGEYVGGNLMGLLQRERVDKRAGLRDTGQPSQALTEIEQRLLKSEFTPDERRRIRLALGIDPMSDTGLLDVYYFVELTD